MSEMVERVAKRLYEKIHSSPIPPNWGMVVGLGGQHVWLDLARAAIEAMREPTEAMRPAQTKEIWQIMIDEALK